MVCLAFRKNNKERLINQNKKRTTAEKAAAVSEVAKDATLQISAGHSRES